MQLYELHKSQISEYFVYWFRNGEDIFQAVFRKNSLKMSVLYWRVPYIFFNPSKEWLLQVLLLPNITYVVKLFHFKTKYWQSSLIM